MHAGALHLQAETVQFSEATVDCAIVAFADSCMLNSAMPLILILVILLLVVGGGGYYMGPGIGYYGGGTLDIILVLIIIYVVLGRGRSRL